MKLQNKTRSKKSTSLNIFQPWLKITQQCYNKTNVLFKNMDVQIGRLIDKL